MDIRSSCGKIWQKTKTATLKGRGFLLVWLKWAVEKMKALWIRFKVAMGKLKVFLLSTVWPVVKKILVVMALCVYFGGVAYLTYKGSGGLLTNDYANLFGVLTSTTGTVIAIFFSLVLIPLNQIASRYSPRFLKYLKKDLFFVSVFTFSIATLIYDVAFLFVGSNKMLAGTAILLFLSLIIVIGSLIFHIIKLSNPYYSILLPAHKEIVKNFRKWMPRYLKWYQQRIKKDFTEKDLLPTALNTALFQVDKRITDYIQNNLLPIREVAIKAIKGLDLEQAQNSIQTMMSVVVNYLYSRREYHSDNDPLLYFLYSEFKLIAVSANNTELKLRLHESMAECWRQVGIQAALVKVKNLKRLGDNFNNLVVYPVLGLKEICSLNLLEMDSYAPGKACDALADIGVQLMKEGYDNQAASVVEDLEKISLIAEQNKINNVSGRANYGIVRVYCAGMIYRKEGSKDPYNHPYRNINKSIDRLLSAFLLTKRNTFDNMILSPFIGNFMDPFEGIYLSRVSEFGIFTEDLDKFSIDKNLKCVGANIESIKKAILLLAPHKDWYFSNQALENLYRIALNLLSYLSQPMAKDHIIFYKKPPFIDEELRKSTSDLILATLNVFTDLVESRSDQYLFENDHIHILFSLYLIILYENKLRPNELLDELFKQVHQQFVKLLEDYKKTPGTDSNDDTYKFYRLLVDVLNKNSLSELAKDFVVPAFEYRSHGIFGGGSESSYPETMYDGQWIIKRPGFQVNAYYYNDIETALKLDVMKFY